VDETEAGSSGLTTIMTLEQRGGAEPERSLRIVIADDHLLMAQGLAKLLQEDFEVVSTVNNGRDLLAAAVEHRADLALMDVCMPGLTGMETARSLRSVAPQCKIILISMYRQAEFVREAFAAGASGYLLKSSASEELWKAIREVMLGNVYVSSCVTKDVLASFLTPPPARLSPREREILALVAEGCSAKEIAARLHIAVKTAQFHRTNIMTKLGVHTTAELTKYALGHGIVSY
jgi:DNA-binding NarL/FixJ family response regulator